MRKKQITFVAIGALRVNCSLCIHLHPFFACALMGDKYQNIMICPLCVLLFKCLWHFRFQFIDCVMWVYHQGPQTSVKTIVFEKNIWEYGTYHIGQWISSDEPVCGSAKSLQSLRCSHTERMRVDEDSGKDIGIWPYLEVVYAGIKSVIYAYTIRTRIVCFIKQHVNMMSNAHNFSRHPIATCNVSFSCRLSIHVYNI